jgi:thioredoxin 1
MSIPTIMVLKNRTQIFSQPGAFPEPAFRDLIDQAIALEVPAPKTEESAETETENSG